MLRITYRAVLFPPLGGYRAVTSEGREFVIKSSALGVLNDPQIKFCENDEELFTARFVDRCWVMSDNKDSPDFSLKSVGGLTPKWEVSYNGESFCEDEIHERIGITFANATMPNSHIVTYPSIEQTYPALIFGALKGRLPD